MLQSWTPARSCGTLPALGGRVVLKLPKVQFVVEVRRQIQDITRVIPLQPCRTAEFHFFEHGVDAQAELPVIRVLEPDEAGHRPIAHVEVADRDQFVPIVDTHLAGVEHGSVKSAGQVLVEGGVDEALETRFVQGVERFLLRIRLGGADAEGEPPVATVQPLALALLQGEAVQVHPDVDHTEDARLDAQQVNLVQHHAPPEPSRREVLVVPLGRQFAGKVRLDEHGHKVRQPCPAMASAMPRDRLYRYRDTHFAKVALNGVKGG